MQIGSTSIIPLKGAAGSGLLEKLGLDDDQSDRDEADASDDDIFNPDDEELLLESLSPTMTVASKDHDPGDKDAACFKKISKIGVLYCKFKFPFNLCILKYFTKYFDL